MASESSFYRILREVDQLQHRGRAASPAPTKKPAPYIAEGPNQVWSWDITYLASNLKGVFFFLYLFMDIYSRKIVGWEVYENESSEQAADVLRKARLADALVANHELVLHSDNGSPMKGATMLATMQKLGIVPSFSRPSVSNDNPFSESLKTRFRRCAQAIAKDGMYAGFAGAKTGHGCPSIKETLILQFIH